MMTKTNVTMAIMMLLFGLICLQCFHIATAKPQGSMEEDTSLEETWCVASGQWLYKRDGRCYTLNTRGPCQEQEWFVLTADSFVGICKKLKCDRLYASSPSGFCLHSVTDLAQLLQDSEVCQGAGNNTRAQVDVFGKPKCVCQEGYIKYTSDGQCYEEEPEDTCNLATVLQANEDTGEPECSEGNSVRTLVTVEVEEDIIVQDFKGAEHSVKVDLKALLLRRRAG